MTPDGDAVDTAHLGFTTSPHEECAVEEAVQIAEQHDGEVTVLTLGPAESEEQLRYAASVGAHNLVLIPITEVDWDPQRTASALTTAISGIEAADGTFDLILFGNESADTGGFQVGIRVAHALGRPVVNGIKGIDLQMVLPVSGVRSTVASRSTRFRCRQYSESRRASTCPLPTMKGRLASKKAEVSATAVEAAAGGQTRVRLHRPLEQVSETVILGTGPEAAPAVVDLLEELGVLS